MSALSQLRNKIGGAAKPANRANPTPKISKVSRISRVPHLLIDIEATITDWLDYIGEHDSALRQGCVRACRKDPELRAYFLKRAEEVPCKDHERVLRDLEAHPEHVRAIEVIDPDTDPVRIIIAIRDVGICELLVARDKWDPFQFLALIGAEKEPCGND